MPVSWYLEMTGLRVAVEHLVNASGTAALPPENVERLRSLLPAILQWDSGWLRDREYRVPLVAPMKAGKSSLLNAMLCQNLLPARGPAMTVLPARVVVEAAAARQRPILIITTQQRVRLAQLADRRVRDSVATALRRYPLLEGVADAVRRWPPGDLEQAIGQAAVRQWLADINDLLRLALVVLPGDDIVAGLQAIGALSVYAPVSWLDADASSVMRLVLVDTPGPDEELRPGVLNGLVEDQVRHAHELLVVADATRRASEAEASVRKLTDSALPWPGWAQMLVAVNRADMVPELEDLLGTGKMIGDDTLLPELRAIWDRLSDGVAGMSARAVVTAARHGQAAAGVLQPAESQEAADQADQAFRRLIRRARPGRRARRSGVAAHRGARGLAVVRGAQPDRLVP